MVRYPDTARSSVAALENLLIQTRTGEAIRIGQVANVNLGEGLSSIERTDRKRTVNVIADADPSKIQSGIVVSDITENFIPDLLDRYPDIQFDLGGSSKEEQTLIAHPYRIYGRHVYDLWTVSSPFKVLYTTISHHVCYSLGFVGAVVGHILFGVTMSMLSVMGLIALAGVVVNDSLILVEFANRRRVEGETIEQALLSAGQQRFRAIVLTTLTTFVGLLPMFLKPACKLSL